MAANHHIDHDNRLIITQWEGEPDDSALLDAYNRYQQEYKSQEEYHGYNELVDFGGIQGFRISSKGLKMIGSIAAQKDKPGNTSKLALVVSSVLAYGLARMYTAIRSFDGSGKKEVRVFKSKPDALDWLIGPTQ